jgi:preprotein translocase subunit SecE
MAMNREQKRMLKRQGELGPDGETPAPRRDRPTPRPQNERTKPAEFAREVRGELRKVAWPTREEVVRFSMIVLVTIVLLTLFVTGVDYLSAEGILLLFEN